MAIEFFISLEKLHERWRHLLKLPANITIFFPLKVNSSSAIIHALNNLGANYLVTNNLDYNRLTAHYVKEESILFGNKIPNIKTIPNSIKMLEIDSPTCSECVPTLQKLNHVLLRLMPPSKSNMDISNYKWGLSFDELKLIIQRFQSHLAEKIICLGFHISNSSLSKNMNDYIELFKNTQELLEFHHITPNILDLGGSIDWYNKNNIKALKAICNSTGLNDVWIEPGSFLINDCVSLRTTVVDVRRRAGLVWVYIDASIHDGLLDKILSDKMPVFTFSDANNRKNTQGCIVGYTSDIQDIFGVHQIPNDIVVGEPIEITNIGAYFSNLFTGLGRIEYKDEIPVQCTRINHGNNVLTMGQGGKT